jgi:hypothetical protein
MPQATLTDRQFLKKLQEQAELQAQLSTTRILPEKADLIMTFVGNHPWQTLVTLATLSTVLMLVIGKVG